MTRLEPTADELSYYTWLAYQYTEESVRKAIEVILGDPQNVSGILDISTFSHYVRPIGHHGLGYGVPKKCYSDFDSYVADHPEGERFRDMLTANGTRDRLAILPSDGGILPGGFIWAAVVRYTSPQGLTDEYGVLVNDGDDAYLVKRPLSEAQAVELMMELFELAPFRWADLLEFGYTRD